MAEQKSRMRFDEGEMIALKNTFSDNEELIKTMRRVFLQSKLSVEDIAIVNTIFKEDSMKALITKFFNPTISGQEHLNQVVDLWTTLQTKELAPDYVALTVKARDILIKYIVQQIDKLFNLDSVETIILSDLIKFDEVYDTDIYINLVARNSIIQHVEDRLTNILVLAGDKNETVENTMRKMKKNSSK